jgi:hypothetical protein
MPLPWARVSINQQPYKAPRVGDRRPDMPDSFQHILSALGSGTLQLGVGGIPLGASSIRSFTYPWAHAGWLRLGATDTLQIGSSIFGVNTSGQATVNGVAQTNTFQYVPVPVGTHVLAGGAYAIIATFAAAPSAGTYLLAYNAPWGNNDNAFGSQGPNFVGPNFLNYINGVVATGSNLVQWTDPIALEHNTSLTGYFTVNLLGQMVLNAGDVVSIRGASLGAASPDLLQLIQPVGATGTTEQFTSTYASLIRLY